MQINFANSKQTQNYHNIKTNKKNMAIRQHVLHKPGNTITVTLTI
jgi:hypothetical protein